MLWVIMRCGPIFIGGFHYGPTRQPARSALASLQDGSLPLTSYDPIEASVGSKSFEEEVIIKSFVLSDFATKTAYFSLVAAAVVFVSMLLLTGLHP